MRLKITPAMVGKKPNLKALDEEAERVRLELTELRTTMVSYVNGNKDQAKQARLIAKRCTHSVQRQELLVRELTNRDPSSCWTYDSEAGATMDETTILPYPPWGEEHSNERQG